MAKGDDSRSRNQVQQQGGIAQNNLNNQQQRSLGQNQFLQNQFQSAVGQQGQDYSNLMGQFQNIANRPDFTMNPQYKGNVDQALAGYGNFAQTGGFSPQDIQDIRARSIAPTRAAYSNANREVDRQRALQGGYSPNFIAAKAKMAREQGQSLADANTNANAAIAQMTQQGKLAGMAGLGNLGSSQEGLANNIDQQNLQRLFGAAEGQRSVYGTNPALASMFGNQALQSSGQQVDLQGLQNQLAQMIMQGQLGASQLPGKFQSAMGNIGSGLGLAGQIGGMFNPLSSLFGGAGRVLGARQTTPNFTTFMPGG